MTNQFKQYGDFIFNLQEVAYVSIHVNQDELQKGLHEIYATFHLKSGDSVETASQVIHEERIFSWFVNLENLLNNTQEKEITL